VENLNQHQASSERVILVSVAVQMLADLDAEEFHLLAQSAGANILQHVHAQRIKPDAKLFIGSGKAEEIAEVVAEYEAELVIFDHALTPAQARNLERIMRCRVVDRTELILDIFAQRARTYEGKLQVELAQLQHMASRLIRSRGDLDSQKGGIGLRGPGWKLTVGYSSSVWDNSKRNLRKSAKHVCKVVWHVKKLLFQPCHWWVIPMLVNRPYLII